MESIEGGWERGSVGVEVSSWPPAGGGPPAVDYYISMPWERELEVLEEAIRRLGVEFDAFLYGTATKPPSESRKHVEQMIRRLNAVQLDGAAERYRFSTLQGRYTTMTERWERLQSEKESGRRPGLYGHFSAHAGASSPPRAAAPPPASPNARVPGSVESREGADSADRRLFEAYREARQARGEDAQEYEKFAESLAKERARLKERLGTEDFVFEVAEREGKVKLIAKRLPASPSGKAE
jgi:hypothetical protein